MHRIVLHMNWFFKQRSVVGGSSIIGISVIFVTAHPSSSVLSPQSLIVDFKFSLLLIDIMQSNETICLKCRSLTINTVAFPPMRYAFIILALEHPIVAHWHDVVGLVIRFSRTDFRAIYFIFPIDTIQISILSMPMQKKNIRVKWRLFDFWKILCILR